MSLEEPKCPKALAAAQKVVGAHGAGQCWLPGETQAQVRAEGTPEQGPWGQTQPLAFASVTLGPGKGGVGLGGGDLPHATGTSRPIQETHFQIPTELLTCCVSSAKLLHPSEP